MSTQGTRTPEQQAEIEQKLHGCARSDVLEGINEQIEMYGLPHVLSSILSDV